MMRRMIFQLDDDLRERVSARARERGVSEAQVVRDALERDLEMKAPPISWIGTMATGHGDLSERAAADEYEPPPWRS